jgi:hypothetical protein
LRADLPRLLGLGAWLLLAAAAHAQAPACTRADFQAIVDGAAATLRDLNQKNRPLFQEKLRELKAKRGWSNDQFLKEAAPLVKDDKIDGLDNTSSELLARISAMGQEGANAKAPDCSVMSELNAFMQQLVAAQTEKWTYMFEKLSAELAK